MISRSDFCFSIFIDTKYTPLILEGRGWREEFLAGVADVALESLEPPGEARFKLRPDSYQLVHRHGNGSLPTRHRYRQIYHFK
jgi:hypothetical protein